jgi:hypothetical protein
MSAPVPSPSIKGIIGSFGTVSLPFTILIFDPDIITCFVGAKVNKNMEK